MRPIQRIISIGFATAALASASLPALSWTVWPDVDQAWVPGRWIRDDYADRVALQIVSETTLASGPFTLYDRQGNAIPVTPEAYPVGSAASVMPPDSNRR